MDFLVCLDDEAVHMRDAALRAAGRNIMGGVHGGCEKSATDVAGNDLHRERQRSKKRLHRIILPSTLTWTNGGIKTEMA